LLITKIISIGLQKQLQYESIKAQKRKFKHHHFMDGKDNASVILSDNRLYLFVIYLVVAIDLAINDLTFIDGITKFLLGDNTDFQEDIFYRS
jgi:hypothetical protein